MGEIADKFIEAGGIRTRYIEQGQGAPLLLIHGGGAGADSFSNFVHCLPVFGEHRRTIAVDMIGFGETDQPDPAGFAYTQQARTKHIIDFIEAMALGPVAIVGNSMGGTTATGVALQRPDLVSHLILMGAAANMPPEIIKERGPVMAPLVAFDGTLDGVRKIIALLAHSYQATDAQIEYRQRSATRPAAIAANKATMAWVKENGLCYSDAELASLACPVLVIAGKNDVIVTLDRTVDLIAKIPQAVGHIIPECGHWVMIEYPEEFTRQTLWFLGHDPLPAKAAPVAQREMAPAS